MFEELEIVALKEGETIAESREVRIYSVEGVRYALKGKRKPNGNPRDTDTSEEVAFQKGVSYLGLLHQSMSGNYEMPSRIHLEFGERPRAVPDLDADENRVRMYT